MEVENSQVNKKDALFDEVFALSLKTLKYVGLFIILTATLIFLCFPSYTMRLCNSMELYDHALGQAKAASKSKKTETRIEALLYGIEISDNLFTDKGEGKYAQSLMEFTNKYATEETFFTRNQRFDNYYRTELATTAIISNLYNMTSFFSYTDYIYTLNFKGRTVTNNTDKILVTLNGKSGFISINDLDTFINAVTANELAIIFNQMYVYVLNASDTDVLYEGGFTDIYNALKGRISYYLSQSVNEEDLFKKLYLFKAVSKLEYALNQLHQEITHDITAEVNEIKSLLKIDGLTIDEYVNEHLI